MTIRNRCLLLKRLLNYIVCTVILLKDYEFKVKWFVLNSKGRLIRDKSYWVRKLDVVFCLVTGAKRQKIELGWHFSREILENNSENLVLLSW